MQQSQYALFTTFFLFAHMIEFTWLNGPAISPQTWPGLQNLSEGSTTFQEL